MARDQIDMTPIETRDELVAWFEADRCGGGNVEPFTKRLLAIEFQRRIHLKEMVVRANLNRPIPRIANLEGRDGIAGIDLNISGGEEQPTDGNLFLI